MFTFVWNVKEAVYYNPPSVFVYTEARTCICYAIHCSKYDVTVTLIIAHS